MQYVIQRCVVIIGSGIPGLRAATILRNQGIDVLTLKALTDRIGGRVKTSRKANNPFREIGM